MFDRPMKWAFAALVAALAMILVAGITPTKAQDMPDRHWTVEEMNRVVDQTNFIVAQGCSGTLISLVERLVLTNYHCVGSKIKTVKRERSGPDGRIQEYREERRDPVTIEQRSYHGFETVGSASYVAEIVAHRENRDLALLQIRAEDIPHSLASPLLNDGRNVHRGEKVWVVGNPAGMESTIVEGVVSSVTRTFRFPWAGNEDLPMIQFSGGAYGGNSGGALYNAYGELIGVPAAAHRQATFIGLAIPVGLVKEFLADECFAEVYDPNADDEACRAESKGEEG